MQGALRRQASSVRTGRTGQVLGAAESPLLPASCWEGGGWGGQAGGWVVLGGDTGKRSSVSDLESRRSEGPVPAPRLSLGPWPLGLQRATSPSPSALHAAPAIRPCSRQEPLKTWEVVRIFLEDRMNPTPLPEMPWDLCPLPSPPGPLSGSSVSLTCPLTSFLGRLQPVPLLGPWKVQKLLAEGGLRKKEASRGAPCYGLNCVPHIHTVPF